MLRTEDILNSPNIFLNEISVSGATHNKQESPASSKNLSSFDSLSEMSTTNICCVEISSDECDSQNKSQESTASSAIFNGNFVDHELYFEQDNWHGSQYLTNEEYGKMENCNNLWSNAEYTNYEEEIVNLVNDSTFSPTSSNASEKCPVDPLLCSIRSSNDSSSPLLTQNSSEFPFVRTEFRHNDIFVNDSEISEDLQYIQWAFQGNCDEEPTVPDLVHIKGFQVLHNFEHVSTSTAPVAPKKKNREVLLHLKRNRKSKAIETAPQPAVMISLLDSDDDDVICVEDHDVAKTVDATRNNCGNVLPSQSKSVKRTKHVEPTRKNPKRKAQLEKTSMDLARKLSLPSQSIFNARTKTAVNRREHAPLTRNCRRSSRTTGAVLCPPSPLGKSHIREWPTEGMHERPKYNSNTNTIEKFDCAMRNITNDARIANASKLDETKPVPKSPKSKENAINSNQNKKILVPFEPCRTGITYHKQLHDVITYVISLQELHKINRNRGDNDAALELRENSKASPQKEKYKKKFANMIQCRKNVDLECAVELLLNSCVLYSLFNNIDEDAFINYITSLSLPSAAKWLTQQL